MKFPKIDYTVITLTIILVVILIQLYRRRNIEYWYPKSVPPITKRYPVVMYTSYNKSYADKPFVKLNAEILSSYAKLHGHTYRKILHDDDFMSPYWTRVYDLVEILNSVPDDTIVMYFDADAVPKHDVKHISIDGFLNSVDTMKSSRGNFYVSEDPNVKYDIFYRGIFNSGVFAVRANKTTRALANSWLSMYNNGHTWVRQGDQWVCKIGGTTCFWSFSGYEQYALTKLYKQNPSNFTRLHWSTMACTNVNNNNCFVLHLMGKKDSERQKIFTKILQTYKLTNLLTY